LRTTQVIHLSLYLSISITFYVYVGSNKIEHFPPELFSSLTKLTQLHLYKNKLSALPPEIGNLQHIRKLTFSSNNLRGLPDEIAACSTLEELYINNNAKFSYFPGAAGALHCRSV
jgi:hypothetical protein